MSKKLPKIVSLLPSTTEIVSAIGLQGSLVGRSHECDFPASVTALQQCTEPKFKPMGTSYQIDQRVKALLQEGLSIYRVNADLLAELQPDIIITQNHCEVCAVSFTEVKEAVEHTLGSHVEVISVSPVDLEGVFDSISSIAEALEVSRSGAELIQNMENEFQEVRVKTNSLSPKSIVCIEWLNPLMTAGNWVPELVDIAGGQPLGAEAGKHSPWFAFEQLLNADPEIICLMPCGYSIQQTLLEIQPLTSHEVWHQLEAVRNNQVYVLDGNQFFNRPGPRLTNSTRILAEILHPDEFEDELSFQHRGWINLSNQQATAQ